MTRPRLRPYQADDLREIERAYGSHRAICYQAPTGSGKTVLAAEFINRQDDEHIIVLAHRDEIVQQICDALTTLGIGHGVIAAGYPESPARVQVGSVMTVVRRLHRIKPPSLVWIDEAHHAAAPSWRTILDHWNDADYFATTATPRRFDGKPLDDIFDHLIVGPSIAELVDDGYLAPVRVFTPARDPDLSRVTVRAGDYAVDQLAHVMSSGMIINGAVDEFERLCPDASAIAFCVDIRHSKLVAEAFRARGYRAEHVDGDTPRNERRELIAALDSGELDILSNCALISEGLDVPGVEAAILLRPTKSLALYLQMVGRALRPGKPMAFVLDHAGNVSCHGLPTARRRWSLHGREVDDHAAAGLRRCPQCGAVNDADAEVCEHCGAPLVHQPRTRLEIASPRLAEAVETPANDVELANMKLFFALSWATGDDGRLLRERLERIAAVRGYATGWVYHNAGRSFDEAWAAVQRWRATQG